MAVLDCGRKSIGIDRTLPEVVSGEGVIRYEHGEHFIHEEHIALELGAGLAARGGRPRRADAGLLADDRELLRHLPWSATIASWSTCGRSWPLRQRDRRRRAGVGPRRALFQKERTHDEKRGQL